MGELEFNPEKRIALFQRKEVRRVIHNNEWWFVILTAEISKVAFSLTPTEYAEFKKLKRENPRDHMTDLELIFSMLGEAATTEIARNRDAQGFPQNQKAARSGGKVAGNARRELEMKSGRKVVTSENYLALAQSVKKMKRVKKRK